MAVNELHRSIREEIRNGSTTVSGTEEAIWNGHSLSEIAEFIGEANLRAMLRQLIRQVMAMDRRVSRNGNGRVVGTATRLAAAPEFFDAPNVLPDGAIKFTRDLSPEDVEALAAKLEEDAKADLAIAKGYRKTAKLARARGVSKLLELYTQHGMTDLPGFSS